jgi:hypothetical protein
VHRWTMQVSAWLLSAMLLAPELSLARPAQQSAPAATSPQSDEPVGQNQEDQAAPQTTNPAPLPDAPSAQTTTPGQNQNNDNTPQQTPEGTAAAQAAKTKGGAASKPAGAAIAPAKQRRTRSLLIKIGVIAGAGAALGSVYALTHGSPARPPGAP